MTVTGIVEQLTTLANELTESREDRERAGVRGAWLQAARYRQFIGILGDECGELYGEFTENVERQNERAKAAGPGSRAMSEEEIEMFVAMQDLTVRLHLKMEAMLLFGQILLDRAALAIRATFGDARGVSIKSHSRLVKNLASFVSSHGLPEPPQELGALIEALDRDLSDFRDDRIAHEINPRVFFGTMWTPGVGVQLVPSVVYPGPKEVEPLAPSPAPDKLVEDLDAYLALLVGWVRSALT